MDAEASAAFIEKWNGRVSDAPNPAASMNRRERRRRTAFGNRADVARGRLRLTEFDAEHLNTQKAR